MLHDPFCPEYEKEHGMCYAAFTDTMCQCRFIKKNRDDQTEKIKEIINYRILDYSECNRDDECIIKADAGKTYLEDIEHHYGENNGQISF